MLKPDVIRLRHMREAAAYTHEMAAGRKRSDLDKNAMLRMALTLVWRSSAKPLPR